MRGGNDATKVPSRSIDYQKRSVRLPAAWSPVSTGLFLRLDQPSPIDHDGNEIRRPPSHHQELLSVRHHVPVLTLQARTPLHIINEERVATSNLETRVERCLHQARRRSIQDRFPVGRPAWLGAPGY